MIDKYIELLEKNLKDFDSNENIDKIDKTDREYYIQFFYGEFSENFILKIIEDKFFIEWCGYGCRLFYDFDEVITYIKDCVE